MFTVALSTTAKTSKQPENNCPSTEEQIELYMHTMDHYSALKKNGIMTLAAIFVHLEITILSCSGASWFFGFSCYFGITFSLLYVFISSFFLV